MSAWRGLHNPERHESLPPTEHEEAVPACLDCQSWCSESSPCRCCLAAEVERLTGELAERDRHIAATLAYCDQHNDTNVGAAAAAILRGESDG